MTAPKSTPITIPATVAHRQFGELIRRAYSGKEHFIVEKDGLPVVAILSMTEYEELIQERERRQRFKDAARAIGDAYEQQGLTEEETLADLEKTREDVYREHYDDSRSG